jgi:hypothetical protein
MITLSIDVTLLEKARFKEVVRQNGKKAIFAELVLFETPNGQYGDFMVKQSVTREERAAKKEMPILGNAKWGGGGKSSGAPATAESTSDDTEPPF